MPRISWLKAGTPVIGSLLLLAHVSTEGSGGKSATGAGPPAPERYPIIPAPWHLEARPGEFRLDRATRIMLSDPASTELRALAELMAAPLREVSGLQLPISPEPATDRAPHAIAIRLTPGSASGSAKRPVPREWFARVEGASLRT